MSGNKNIVIVEVSVNGIIGSYNVNLNSAIKAVIISILKESEIALSGGTVWTLSHDDIDLSNNKKLLDYDIEVGDRLDLDPESSGGGN